jgi:hypothetical protein
MPRSRNGNGRLPDCMLCVLDHLAPGLPPGPQALLIRYARHAHGAGCGSYPGLRGLSRDLRTSHDTLQKWRDDLFLERRLIDRLPRVAPCGGDLIRLRCDQCQRAPMQARCGQCQRANLQHTETEWSDALQRARTQAQKRRALQMVPAATPVIPDNRPADPSPNGDGRPEPSRRFRTPPAGRQQAADALSTTKPSQEGKQQQPARQAPAGAIIPFQARSSDAGARAGATRTGSRPPRAHPPERPSVTLRKQPAADDAPA